MSVKCKDGWNRLTMEEICRESRFDPENMSEKEHLQELCMVAKYLLDSLQYYANECQCLRTSKDTSDTE